MVMFRSRYSSVGVKACSVSFYDLAPIMLTIFSGVCSPHICF